MKFSYVCLDFGKYRREPTKHDLQNAIEAVVAGEPVRMPTTKAIGCYIHGPAASDTPDGR